MMDISICMSFRNEGQEVANTCKNIREISPDIPIICVNDASDDGFDYENSLKPYNITYIKNPKPFGCSLGRERALEECKTKWFMMLDAHCRIYTKDWIQKLEEKNLDEKAIYCCTCVSFTPENDSYNEKASRGCGATLGKGKNLLNPKWGPRLETRSEPYDIKIILGANYISTKEWWNYIRGFHGLRRYGRDETLVSLKSYMAGGKVQYISDIITGHLFRKKAPYPIPTYHVLYNELAIVSICCPELLNKYEKFLKKYYNEADVQKAISEIELNSYELNNEHLKLLSIQKCTFEEAYKKP